MSGYAKRKINVTFQLGPVSNLRTGQTTYPKFVEAGADTVKLRGLRVQALITKAGGASMGAAQIRIFGMSLSLMNQLSTLGKIPTATRNTIVTVEAGDDTTGMSVVFKGNLSSAFADMQSAPEAAFNVMAYAGLYDALAPVEPTSFRGTADVATIMSGLANQMGLTFENNAVDVKLNDPYFPGTARAQAQACADAAGINWIIDNGVLAIWPRGAARGSAMPLISPETGLVGYPGYTDTGIVIRALYTPSITYGGKVEVRSTLTPACGVWRIYTLFYELESETPGGAWFTTVQAAELGYAPVR